MEIEEETESVGEDHPKASSICAIDKKSVHRICSGQVVLTLGTAVKELLENSIDAGATIVDIKLKEYGSELIEVSDNGLGVHPLNFDGLTLKHHTSKLRDFGDLINVDTFGFRGEALSSLCALCDLNVTTRHKDEAVGTKLEFDHNGKITKKEAQARQVGTKVVLQNLFYTLPVRHKEFQRNVKKDFVKMVQVLNSYCIISTGVRITCTNVTNKGSRSTVVSSQGNVLLQENISNVFGPKQIQSLLEFKQKVPGEDVCSEYGLKGTAPSLFKIEGFVSKCEHGQGRSSTDRQFFYINGRPFDSTKVTKVVNEVYHQYNRHQYPFVVLKVGVNKEGVDVNVTPDKRQVFMEGEKILLATIKSSLIAMFESTTSILQMHQPDITSKLARRRSEPVNTENCMRLSNDASLQKSNNLVSSLSKLKRSFSSAFAKPTGINDIRQSPSKCSPLPKQRRMDCFVSKAEALKSEEDISHSINLTERETEEFISSNNEMSNNKEVSDRDKTDRLTIGKQHDGFSAESIADHDGSKQDIITIDETGDHSVYIEQSNKPDVNQTISKTSNTYADDTCLGNNDVSYTLMQHSVVSKVESGNERTSSNDESVFTGHCIDHSSTDEQDTKGDVVDKCHSHSVETNDNKTRGISISYHGVDSDNLHYSKEMKRNKLSIGTKNCPIEIIPHESVDKVKREEEDDHQVDDAEDFSKAETIISFSFEDFKQKWKTRSKEESNRTFSRTFRATINPSDNQAAEQELQKEIKKESFSQMEICGQFNMGFIITKLGEDLFIVDQHASDEKYNFETLQRDTVIQSQKLICPMNLELIASNETILMDNLDVFKKNGFEFLIDEQGPPTQRVKLISTPVSKNWNFGKGDIEEMIFMLTDSAGVMCRPSRVRAMFASRACRKSIMIGTVMNKSEMRKLLIHMGEIEQPWNCPHGRPTMRHLINLDMIPK